MCRQQSTNKMKIKIYFNLYSFSFFFFLILHKLCKGYRFYFHKKKERKKETMMFQLFTSLLATSSERLKQTCGRQISTLLSNDPLQQLNLAKATA